MDMTEGGAKEGHRSKYGEEPGCRVMAAETMKAETLEEMRGRRTRGTVKPQKPKATPQARGTEMEESTALGDRGESDDQREAGWKEEHGGA